MADFGPGSSTAMELIIRQASNKASILKTTRDALLEYYTFLTTLPHINPNALQIPPPEGWPGVDAQTLREQARTEDAIEFLRHLPCLVHGQEESHPELTYNTHSLYFCDGETVNSYVLEILKTPGHVVWMTNSPDRNGTYLLLDTLCGSITTWGLILGTVSIPYEEYELLPESDKWMGYETLSVQDWCRQEIERYKTLYYMPLPLLPGDSEAYFLSIQESDFEEQLVYEVLGEVRSDEDYVHAEVGEGSDDGLDDDEDIDPTELEGLQKDFALGPVVGLDVSCSAEVLGQSVSLLSLSKTGGSWSPAVEQRVKQVFLTYISNGWNTSDWDRETCKSELYAWAMADREDRKHRRGNWVNDNE